jgi:hypothetical protein
MPTVQNSAATVGARRGNSMLLPLMSLLPLGLIAIGLSGPRRDR